MRRRNLRAGGIDDTSSKLDTYRTTHPTCSRRPAMSTETIDLTPLTGDYTIDASHSTPGVNARHALVTKVHGAVTDSEGTVTADPSQEAHHAGTTCVSTCIPRWSTDR